MSLKVNMAHLYIQHTPTFHAPNSKSIATFVAWGLWYLIITHKLKGFQVYELVAVSIYVALPSFGPQVRETNEFIPNRF